MRPVDNFICTNVFILILWTHVQEAATILGKKNKTDKNPPSRVQYKWTRYRHNKIHWNEKVKSLPDNKREPVVRCHMLSRCD